VAGQAPPRTEAKREIQPGKKVISFNVDTKLYDRQPDKEAEATRRPFVTQNGAGRVGARPARGLELLPMCNRAHRER
jgi:hypothetical protein